MGEVWEAQDETLGRPIAVKVISLLAGGGSRCEEARARFLREARITARLQHPNIVTIHDLGETSTGDAKAPFLVMELVRGEGMDAMLRRGVVTLPDAVRWGSQVCDALTDAHDAGIMHRDVKPSNVLITPSGIVKVLDFGIAKAVDPYATTDHLTQTGFIVGTPAYMAPEQARGLPEPRSDLYALGCLLFELITGRLPFQAPDTVGYLSAHLTQEPPAPSSVSPGIPSAWDDLVLNLLDKDPAQRYANAADVSQALRQLDGRTRSTPPVTLPVPPPTIPATAPLSPAVSPPGPGRVSSPPEAAPPQTPTRLGGPSTGGGDATAAQTGGRTATAAITLALLCLPGVMDLIFKAAGYLRYPDAPTGLIWANLLIGVVEAIALATGALLLFQRKTAGRRIVAAAGGLTALQGMGAGVQFLLSGGELTMDAAPSTLVFVVGPLTAVVAITAVIMAVLPSTGLWCLRRG